MGLSNTCRNLWRTSWRALASLSLNKEASTWILLLPVWTCLLPHRLTSPCLLELAVNTMRLLNLNLQTKNTISNKHKRRSIKITASKIIINKGTHNRTTTTTTRPHKRVAPLPLLESLLPLVTLHLLGMMMTAAHQATINFRTTDDLIAVINNMQPSGEAAIKSLLTCLCLRKFGRCKPLNF